MKMLYRTPLAHSIGSMIRFLFLSIICLYGFIVWIYILKNGAYPKHVKVHVKWLHAAIFLYIQLYFWMAVSDLPLLIHHHFEINAAFSGQPILNSTSFNFFVHLIGCVSGLTLPIISDKLIKRRESVLKYYFVVWPVAFFSQIYGMIAFAVARHEIGPASILLAFFMVFFLFSVFFYLDRGVRKNLFSGRNLNGND